MTCYRGGDFADAEIKDEDVHVTTIKGSWGASDSDRKSGGTWRAKGDCNH